MATEDQLMAEARERSRMAVVAGLAALLTLLGVAVSVAAISRTQSNLPATALFRERHAAGIVGSAVCSALGLVAIAVVLDFLYRATRLRSPDLPRLLRPLPLAAGLGLAVVTVASQVVTAAQLSDFASSGSQTYDEARAALDPGVLGYLGLLMQLAFALAIVIVSLNAMRVGLLTRFLGYLGMVSAALFVFTLVPPIIQIYWLGALAMLLLGRSRSGVVPPAWSSGNAEPWPSAQEMREARVRAADERRAGDPSDPRGTASADDPRGPGAGPSPATSRRKRKKRR